MIVPIWPQSFVLNADAVFRTPLLPLKLVPLERVANSFVPVNSHYLSGVLQILSHNHAVNDVVVTTLCKPSFWVVSQQNFFGFTLPQFRLENLVGSNLNFYSKVLTVTSSFPSSSF